MLDAQPQDGVQQQDDEAGTQCLQVGPMHGEMSSSDPAFHFHCT
jgi:hypothetical protein